jgi:hypothetical protein
MHGADVKSVQNILGHISIETGMKYLHAVSQRLRKTLDLMNVPMIDIAATPLQSNKKGPAVNPANPYL